MLINGASGAVGLAAVQLAKHLGAHVTGVSSARNHDLLRDLGADDVVDYTTTDLATLEPVYDVVFDAVGKTSFGVARRLLKPGGRYLTTVLSLRILWQSVWTRVAGRRSASILFAGLRTPADQSEDLLLLRNLVEQGKLRAVIDRTFEMREIALAHRLVESGHKRGHAVLQVA